MKKNTDTMIDTKINTKMNDTINTTADTAAGAQEVDLEGLTELCCEVYAKKKEFEAVADRLKAYGAEHPEGFVGQTMRLPNGITLTRQTRTYYDFDRARFSPVLVERFMHTRSAEALKLKFVSDKMERGDVEAEELLSLLGLKEAQTTSYTLKVTSSAKRS